MVEDIFLDETEGDVIIRGLENYQRDKLPPEQKADYDERKVAEVVYKETK